MEQTDRQKRLDEDYQHLVELKESSSVFDFERQDGREDRYTITFRGKGPGPNPAVAEDVELRDLHQCDVRLPSSYPERAPDVRWMTPIYHPNVSFSGFINFNDIGLTWQKDLSLDVVCERLWDVARVAYLDLDQATNYAAKSWFEKECTLRLPTDQRPIRDKQTPAASNIIHYQRRGNQELQLPESSATTADPVLFIGEDTPPPKQKPPVVRDRQDQRRPPKPSSTNDIFFIGDE